MKKRQHVGIGTLLICCMAMIISGTAQTANAADACTGRSWSAWTTTAQSSSASLQVETKTQYRYRDKTYTTSSSSSMSGWTRYDSSTSYGSWSDSYPSGSYSDVESRQVQTGTRYHMAHYCTGASGGYQTSYGKFSDSCSYHDLGWFDSLSKFQEMSDVAGTYKYFPNGGTKFHRCSNTCYRFYIVDTEGVYKTQYRGVDYTYYYYTWGGWSSWSDSAYTADSNREVEKRTVYRSRSTAHSWNAGAVTKAATCTATGVKTYTCTLCKQTKTEAIAKTAHTFSSTYTTDKAPTCTVAGSQSQHCTRCGAKQNIRTVPALGHSLASVYTVDKAPTCFDAGSQSLHCTRCGYKDKVQVIPARGHSWDSGVVTKAATSTAEGVKTYTCTVCKAIRTEAISKALQKQKISAKNITLEMSSKKRTKKISVSVKDKAKVTLKLSNKKLKLKKNVVTIPANFAGTCKIVIKTAATSKYAAGSKNITLKVLPPATKLISLKENTREQIYRVYWKPVSKVSGYEVQMSQNKKFKKGVKKYKGSATSADFDYSTGKTYYFRVRTYKTVSGKSVYSKWSKVLKKYS